MLKPTTFPEAKAAKDALEAELTTASNAWNAVNGVGTGRMGLTSDDVKASAEYQEARARYNRVFTQVREYNAWFLKTWGREYRAWRNERGRAMMMGGR